MPLCARQPTASPQTTMPVRLTTPISRSVVVCPNGTAVRAIGMERNRSMTPLAMSSVVAVPVRSEEHTSELQSRRDLVCRLLLEKKKKKNYSVYNDKKKKKKKNKKHK